VFRLKDASRVLGRSRNKIIYVLKKWNGFSVISWAEVETWNLYKYFEKMWFDQKKEISILIPCCICGDRIEPNSSNMCLSCIRERTSIFKDIPITIISELWKAYWRYQTLQNRFSETLQICLKRLAGFKKSFIIGANFY
jgi:hypothetical protein